MIYSDVLRSMLLCIGHGILSILFIVLACRTYNMGRLHIQIRRIMVVVFLCFSIVYLMLMVSSLKSFSELILGVIWVI